MKTIPWTAEEVSRALEMRASGTPLEQIATRLGRTKKAVRVKLSMIAISQEERDRRNKYERDRRAAQCKSFAQKAGIKFEAHKSRVPEEVIAERDARCSASHRDLTAAFLGDPPRGYSALDRRETV